MGKAKVAATKIFGIIDQPSEIAVGRKDHIEKQS
jgi:hypothetical protein